MQNWLNNVLHHNSIGHLRVVRMLQGQLLLPNVFVI